MIVRRVPRFNCIDISRSRANHDGVFESWKSVFIFLSRRPINSRGENKNIFRDERNVFPFHSRSSRLERMSILFRV